MIETENLTRKFGDLIAVDNLTLRVDDGEVFGFLGPNGAGKTTRVRMLCCLISKTRGKAWIGDYEIGNQDALKIRKIIGLVPDNVGLRWHCIGSRYCSILLKHFYFQTRRDTDEVEMEVTNW